MQPVWICRVTSSALVRACFPPRDPESHKGDYGKILLLCGAEGYTGAAALAANAALRAGSGLVFAGVPRAVYPIVAAKVDGPIVFPLPDQDGKLSPDALPEILERLKTVDACLLGPGLGRSPGVDALVPEIVRHCPIPLVLDADGINAVAGHIDVLRGAACPLVLTPHEGEFRRLTRAAETDRIEGARNLALETGAVVLRKGHTTVITDGAETYVNHTGNAGMATGGSGDVLSGVLTSILGRGLPPLQAAAAAAWLHGRAGDLAAARLGQYAMGPADLLDQLPRLLP